MCRWRQQKWYYINILLEDVQMLPQDFLSIGEWNLMFGCAHVLLRSSTVQISFAESVQLTNWAVIFVMIGFVWGLQSIAYSSVVFSAD